MISLNDKQKSARQVIEYIQAECGATFPPIGEDQINVLIELMDDYPPGEVLTPGVPCEHGFDDNFWCVKCGKGWA